MSRSEIMPVPSELQLYCVAIVVKQMPPSRASRAIIRIRKPMAPPDKPLTDAEVDELYGLEPVIGMEPISTDKSMATGFVAVQCPYCGETFETTADVSAGPCIYV